MQNKSVRSLPIFLLGLVFVSLALDVPSLWAQHGSEGTVTVTVLDSSGGVVQGAQPMLV